MEIGICIKCGSSFAKRRNFDAPIEDLLCPFCIKEWYKFYDENHIEISANPSYKGISNPTWQMWLGRLSHKEKVSFT